MFTMERYPLANCNLENWVKFIWHFEADNVHVHHKLLPMDSIDILLNLADEMIYETATDQIIAPAAHVNSLRSQCSFIHQTGKAEVWGISFYSYGLYPFINKPLKDIQNSVTDLDTVSASLSDELKAAISVETKQRKIESIMKALSSELHTNEKFLERAAMIKEFIKTDEDLSIQSFCMNYGINQRTFERFVLNITGYTPVNLRRIRRYQAASNQLMSEKYDGISEIVYDNNYSDQSHFIKEFKTFSGVPPRTFQEEKNTVLENTDFT